MTIVYELRSRTVTRATHAALSGPNWYLFLSNLVTCRDSDIVPGPKIKQSSCAHDNFKSKPYVRVTAAFAPGPAWHSGEGRVGRVTASASCHGPGRRNQRWVGQVTGRVASRIQPAGKRSASPGPAAGAQHRAAAGSQVPADHRPASQGSAG